jgi:hypothetical protein
MADGNSQAQVVGAATTSNQMQADARAWVEKGLAKLRVEKTRAYIAKWRERHGDALLHIDEVPSVFGFSIVPLVGGNARATLHANTRTLFIPVDLKEGDRADAVRWAAGMLVARDEVGLEIPAACTLDLDNGDQWSSAEVLGALLIVAPSAISNVVPKSILELTHGNGSFSNEAIDLAVSIASDRLNAETTMGPGAGETLRAVIMEFGYANQIERLMGVDAPKAKEWPSIEIQPNTQAVARAIGRQARFALDTNIVHDFDVYAMPDLYDFARAMGVDFEVREGDGFGGTKSTHGVVTCILHVGQFSGGRWDQRAVRAMVMSIGTAALMSLRLITPMAYGKADSGVDYGLASEVGLYTLFTEEMVENCLPCGGSDQWRSSPKETQLVELLEQFREAYASSAYDLEEELRFVACAEVGLDAHKDRDEREEAL